MRNTISMCAATGILTLFIVAMTPGSIVHDARKMKEECERTLPRNAECVMKFVPKVTGESRKESKSEKFE